MLSFDTGEVKVGLGDCVIPLRWLVKLLVSAATSPSTTIHERYIYSVNFPILHFAEKRKIILPTLQGERDPTSNIGAIGTASHFIEFSCFSFCFVFCFSFDLICIHYDNNALLLCNGNRYMKKIEHEHICKCINTPIVSVYWVPCVYGSFFKIL